MSFVGGLARFIWRFTLILSCLALAILLIPGFPPYTSFKPIILAPSLPREGVLAPNNALDNAKRFMIDELVGPEAFQVHDGALYTTLATGEVVKLSPGGHVTFVTKIGQPCEGVWQEEICGRPLGFRIDDAGKFIYIADAYYGIWKVDMKMDKKQLLVPPNVEIEGRIPKIFNSIALAKNGDLYWTDSSSDFHLKDGSYTTLVDPSGRLLHYNAAKNQSRVLINGIWFANGVAISPNEEFVITNECLASRVHRYYISGPKKGQKDIFLDGIPGIVDNIQPIPDGSGVLIGLYKVFDEEHPMISRSLAPFPVIRKLFARILRLLEIPFEYLNQHFPNVYFEKITYSIGHFNSIAPLTPKASGIIQVDWNGNIIGAWFNEDGTTSSISDAIVYQDLLYIGSPHNPFLATVPAPEQLKKAFGKSKADPKIQNEKVKPIEQAKPTEPPVVKKTVESVKETPKPAQTKPVAEKPVEVKPAQVKTVPEKPAQVKPVPEKPAQVKPVPEKPAQVKPVPEKPAQVRPVPEKPAQVKPVPEKPAQVKPVPDKPAQVKPVPEKPAQVKPVPEKPAATKPIEKPQTKSAAEQPKPATPITEQKKPEPTKKETPKQKPTDDKKKPEQIPIVEEIPVDTIKPIKEQLKVIKKEGPVEIPNPEL